jgi:hypothetical protein
MVCPCGRPPRNNCATSTQLNYCSGRDTQRERRPRNAMLGRRSGLSTGRAVYGTKPVLADESMLPRNFVLSAEAKAIPSRLATINSPTIISLARVSGGRCLASKRFVIPY